ncbi:type IV toxin-antitoxin system AbiEi family antitoxin domain-containing protein [Microbacterium sp. B2969]|uniref:Type IV toxin-antitoxin system AbiEi family antitoxin domain-containing protein n=1 Tax=Microbacterium alkaliflavum TaxID=3248839 RepID=A0ABW7QDV3_9MICO
MAGKTIAELGELAAERWGMFTTAQAAGAGVSRKTLSGLSTSGAILRVAQGVYRMAGAPEPEHEFIYAPWLALGGATLPPTAEGVPAVVVAGETAAIAHGIGDWFPGVVDVLTPTRRTTRLPDVRLRTRHLSPSDVVYLNGLPALTVERTIADLLEQWADRSLVVDALRQAAEQGKLLSPRHLAEHLAPIAAAHGAESGADLAAQLMQEAGLQAGAAAHG